MDTWTGDADHNNSKVAAWWALAREVSVAAAAWHDWVVTPNTYLPSSPQFADTTAN
jgi:hypothetical protein